jgi:hypothetical protein
MSARGAFVTHAPVIVQLRGGLGNQLFQYAFALALAQRRRTRLLLDTRLLEEGTRDRRDTPRSYHLDAFMLDAHFVRATDVASLERPSRLFLNKVRNRLLEHGCDVPGRVYLTRYWQSIAPMAAVEARLRDEFRFRVEEPDDQAAHALLGRIRHSDAVGIHVRRGDYSGHPLHGILTPEYYVRAVGSMHARLQHPAYFVFSDDIAWCRSAVAWPVPATFVTCAPDPVDAFRLLRACRHFILSNSTFGWWAAWLRNDPERIVIAPDRWFSDERMNRRMMRNIYPPDWLRLPVSAA